jgi:hypothetical protein
MLRPSYFCGSYTKNIVLKVLSSEMDPAEIRFIRRRMRLLTFLALRKHNLKYVAKQRAFHFLADLIQLGILKGLGHQMNFFLKTYEILSKLFVHDQTDF